VQRTALTLDEGVGKRQAWRFYSSVMVFSGVLIPHSTCSYEMLKVNRQSLAGSSKHGPRVSVRASIKQIRSNDLTSRLSLSHAMPVIVRTAGLLSALQILLPGSSSAYDLGAVAQGGAVYEGFIQSILLVFFSELGDKTFFVALLLSLQRSKLGVFVGAFGALAVMTVICVIIGQVFHQVDELAIFQGTGLPWDDVLAVILLVVFGVQTLRSAADAEADAAEEREEAAEEVARIKTAATATVVSTFAVVFAAEWGDKSFLATIALAAATSPLGVTVGAISGHAAATALAVLGGGYLSKNVSERTLRYAGGSLFLVFAALTASDILQKVM
jgi:putative Ca2+/H+ antiporter (TMEM165/GDT1 family)